MAETWTIRRLLEWTTQFLAKKGVEKATLDTSILLAHALAWKRIELYTRYEEEAPAAARDVLRDLVRRRSEGCPVEYLVGRKDFFSLDFEVSPAVLIPRADSEWIVTECLRLAKDIREPRILDLGTGSGCLAIAIAKHHSEARVTAVDISPDALAIAGRNAARHKVADRVTYLQGDWLSPLPAGEKFDFIVSNPPYVRHADIAGLAREVRDYEPHSALDGGADGLDVFHRTVVGAPTYLKTGGYVIIEIGWDQEAAARDRIAAIAGYELGKTIQDTAGHPRVLCARWRG